MLENTNYINNKDTENEKLSNINKDLLDYTNKVISNIDTVVSLFKQNNITKANLIFSQMIEGLEWIDKYINIICGDNNNIILDHKNVKEIRHDFMISLNDLLSAYKNKNYDNLADTLDKKLRKDIEYYLQILNKLNETA